MMLKKQTSEQSVPCSPREEVNCKSFECSSVTSNESGPIVVKIRLSSTKPNQTMQKLSQDLSLSQRQSMKGHLNPPE